MEKHAVTEPSTASHSAPSTETHPEGPPDGSRYWCKQALHLLLIVVVGFIAYCNTFHAPFVLDDDLSIVDNPVIKNLSSFVSGAGYQYNPRRFIGYLSVALNYRLGGLDVTGYHLFNLAVHLSSACLVYLLARLTLLTPYFQREAPSAGERQEGSGWARCLPLLAALLFVVHPVQTQAVTYIIQRVASLAAMFYLLSLVLYIKARLATESLSASGSPSAGQSSSTVRRRLLPLCCYLGALAAAGLAMKTKEIAFTLPFVVALYEFSFFRMTLRKKIIFLLPVALTVLIVPVSLLGTGKSLGELISDVAERTRVETSIPRLDYLFTQFRVIVTYLRLLIFPVNQNLDYDYPVYHSFFAPQVCLSFLLLLAIAGLGGYLYYRSRSAAMPPAPVSPASLHAARLAAFGIAWFFITLSVESSFIPIADVIFEHRLYLPSVGAFLAIASFAVSSCRNVAPRRLAVGAGVIIAVLASATFMRNQVWGDPVALAEDVVHKSPEKARPHYNLALALQRKERLRDAFHQATLSSRLDPAAAKPHNILGVIYERRGMHEQAVAELSEAVRRDPSYAEAHANLGEALSAAGRKDQALAEEFLALKLKPGNPETYNKIGLIYGETGRMEQAVAFFRSAACLDPANSAFVFNLQRAQQLSQQGQ